MNIFVLDKDPMLCALYHNNKHVIKMILEHAQLMSTCVRHYNGIPQTFRLRRRNGVYYNKIVRVLPGEVLKIEHKVDPVDLSQYDVLTFVEGTQQAYHSTHENHPCAIWVRESLSNWHWIETMTGYLNVVYCERFNHTAGHASYDMILRMPLPNMPDIGLTEFAQATTDQCRVVGNPVQAYRNYYIEEKQSMADWGCHKVPEWFVFKERCE